MEEMTSTEMQQVSGAGTRIGTTGTGDGNQSVIASGSDPAGKATPILF